MAYEKSAATIRKLRKEKYTIIHLTMYGLPPQEVLPHILPKQKVAIVIGADKVPREIYEGADYNVSITRQPHSEVAALGVFLHYLQEGNEETLAFPRAKMRVIPQAKGKRVEKK